MSLQRFQTMTVESQSSYFGTKSAALTERCSKRSRRDEFHLITVILIEAPLFIKMSSYQTPVTNQIYIFK